MSDSSASQLPVHVGEIIDPDDVVEQPLPVYFTTRRATLRAQEITRDHIERFLEHLAATGLCRASAEQCGLSYNTVLRLQKVDEEFKLLYDEALEAYRDSLVEECHRRAVEGWDEAVYSQRLGTKIGTIKKYDGRLLELLLKRHIPEFRDKFEVSHQVSGGVLVAPMAPATVADWQAQHGGKKIELLASGPTDTLPPGGQEDGNVQVTPT